MFDWMKPTSIHRLLEWAEFVSQAEGGKGWPITDWVQAIAKD